MGYLVRIRERPRVERSGEAERRGIIRVMAMVSQWSVEAASSCRWPMLCPGKADIFAVCLRASLSVEFWPSCDERFVVWREGEALVLSLSPY